MARHKPTQWIFVDHACRICLGRLAVRTGENGESYVICAECETELRGSYKALCCCGAKAGPDGGKYPVGLQCCRNESISPDAPSVVTIKFVGLQETPKQRRHSGRRVVRDEHEDQFSFFEDDAGD